MFTSTRKKIKVSSRDAISLGLSEDGGLFIKDLKKIFDEEFFLNNLEITYIKLAKIIFEYFFDDLDEIEEVLKDAYLNNFEKIVDLKKVNEAYFLELFHGPTKAFKDMALTVLPKLLNKYTDNSYIALCATSGDTGSATLASFSPIKTVVLYPTDGVSYIQELQMNSYANKNNLVLAVKGNFDDCQNIVKEILNDTNFKKSLNYTLTSANSINIARLVPQIVYYVYSYIQLLKTKQITIEDKINFCVPSGNFGNALASYISMCLGVKVNKFIIASNDNCVLSDFFKTGVYNRNRPFYKTTSPSMDILTSSNLERLLYLISDEIVTKNLMEEFNKTGQIELDKKMFEKINKFYGNYATEDEVSETIKNVYEQSNYILDPHSAVAYKVYKQYINETNDLTKTIIALTASPFKFPKAVIKAIFNKECSESEAIEMLSTISLNPFKEFKTNHKKIVEANTEAIKKLILEMNNET